MYIPIILGTAREGRRSEKVANYILRQARQLQNVETEILDVRDYRLQATDDSVETPLAKKYATYIIKADGLIIVSPEYNHGYPGELKMLLDMLYKEYNKKPVGFCGVASGGMGGVRAVEQLRLVTIELQMIPISKALYFSNVSTLFNEQGEIMDPSYQERVRVFFEQLLWHVQALKQARQQ